MRLSISDRWFLTAVSAAFSVPEKESVMLEIASVASFRNPPESADPRKEVTEEEYCRSAAEKAS